MRVTVDGKAHWLDPTRRNQEGALEHIYKAYFGWALPLAPGVAALESMGPVAPDHAVDVKERVVFGPKPSSPAIYEWRTSYSSWRADDLRERIDNEGLTAVAKTYLRQLQDVWPGLTAIEPMRIENDPVNNRLTTVEKYEIPAPWKRLDGGRVEFATKDYFISADLADLSANGPRKRDVHLGRPREATRTVELELPVNWPTEGWNIAVEAPGAMFETALVRDRKKKRLFTLTQRLRIERDTMPAADAERYVQLVTAMRKGSDIVIASATSGDAFVKAGGMSGWFDQLRLGIIIFAIVAALAHFFAGG